MKSFEQDSSCPHCGQGHEVATNPDKENPTGPDNGSISVCWNCRKAGVFVTDGDGLKIVKVENVTDLTDLERKEIEARVSLMEDCMRKATTPIEAARMMEFAQEHGFVPRPQIVRFFEDEEERNQLGQIQWGITEEWPPPERLIKITTPEGQGVVADFAKLLVAVEEHGDKFDPGIVFEIYERRKYSKLTDEDLAANEHITRGATYVYGGVHEWA